MDDCLTFCNLRTIPNMSLSSMKNTKTTWRKHWLTWEGAFGLRWQTCSHSRRNRRMEYSRLDNSTRRENIRLGKTSTVNTWTFYTCITMSQISRYLQSSVSEERTVTTAFVGKNRSLATRFWHIPTALRLMICLCPRWRNCLLEKVVLKQTNHREISHPENCRGHSISTTVAPQTK